MTERSLESQKQKHTSRTTNKYITIHLLNRLNKLKRYFLYMIGNQAYIKY